MQPILYLLVGYPGAGKTTVSEKLAKHTGAVHLWADKIRREKYGEPLYTQAVNNQLYAYLNDETTRLLREGRSVIYDTNFNYRRDRDLLRRIADKEGARTVLIWIKTPRNTAKHRATIKPRNMLHRVHGLMSSDHFDYIADKLEPPTPSERPFILHDSTVTMHELDQLSSPGQ